ncbi:MAG: Uma2 family endonuclease [Anaerolineales bacterium]
MDDLLYESNPEAAFKRLLRSPKLPYLVEQFQVVLEDEHAHRERFYEEMTEEQKIEFINGEVIVHSPVKMIHAIVGQRLLMFMNFYVDRNQLGWVGYEKILISLSRNDYEPDICYFSQAKSRAFFPDQMKFPAPDFVVEILSPSTEAIDRGVKFEDYAAHGVGEYWIIDPDRETIEQYALQNDVYDLRVKVKSGVIQSLMIDGFEMAVRAIFDEQEYLKALQKIVG